MAKYQFDFRQTEEYAKFMQTCGWEVVNIKSLFNNKNKQYGFLWKIPIINKYYLSLHRVSGDISFSRLDSFCKEHNVAVCRIDFNQTGGKKVKIKVSSPFKITDWCSAPSKTILIDLTLTPQQLLMNMKPKARYNIGLADKRGVSVKFFSNLNVKSKNIEQFHRMIEVNHGERNLAVLSNKTIKSLLKSFDQKAFLAEAFYKGKLVAGTLFVSDKQTLTYTQNCANKSGRRNFAPSLLIWEAIRLGQKMGLKYFDFDGVFDERNFTATNGWRGFTKFKEAFGGKSVYFPLPIQRIYIETHTLIERLAFLWLKIKLKNSELPSIYPSGIRV